MSGSTNRRPRRGVSNGAGVMLLLSLTGCAFSPKPDVHRLAEAQVDSSTNFAELSAAEVDAIFADPAKVYVEPFTVEDVESSDRANGDEAEGRVRRAEDPDYRSPSAWDMCNARQGCDGFLMEWDRPNQDVFDWENRTQTIPQIAKGEAVEGDVLPSDYRTFEALFVDCSLSHQDEDKLPSCINLVLDFLKIDNPKAAEAVWRDTPPLHWMTARIKDGTTEGARWETFGLFDAASLRRIYPSGREEMYLHAYIEASCPTPSQDGICRFRGVL